MKALDARLDREEPAMRDPCPEVPEDALNQPPPLEGYNLFESDLPLREALAREGGGWGEDRARALGALVGRPEVLAWGDQANRCGPELRAFDRYGRRIGEVEFHPAWHRLMRLGIRSGTHSLPWTDPRRGAHVVRAALMMLRHQVDEGTSCPITMTFAAVPSLRLQPELAAFWEGKLMSNRYDPRSLPAERKRGVLFGMAMTERYGGSDVRSNRTRARPLGAGGPGGEYEVTGHKWFCSAPMCDAFLVLAQARGGVSCFLLPRFKPGGTRNGMQILRLKDKLGNRSNASSEVEFQGAWCRMIGEEGRGIPAILEMVRHTRLDCVLGSAASLRRATAEALHHAAHRRAFGRRLDQQPLMRNVLADLCIESEAATALALRLARAYDASGRDPAERKFGRVATALGKFWVTKRAVHAVSEALECLGGNGYVESFPLARLYRDAPLNSLWEGAGNIQCLDVLRTFEKDPASAEVLVAELRAARGGNDFYDRFLDRLEHDLAAGGGEDRPAHARRLAGRAAVALQGSILLRHTPAFLADAFCASRMGEDAGLPLGSLPAGTPFGGILDRSRPLLPGGRRAAPGRRSSCRTAD